MEIDDGRQIKRKAMRIGIDVGGTHADGVLLEGRAVRRKKKVRVDHSRLSESLLYLLGELLPEEGRLEKIHLSTTLCTNAVVQNRLGGVGMIIQSGPGLNPDFLACGARNCFLGGAIDHRGEVVNGFSEKDVDEAVVKFKEANLDSIGVVTKFSHRNNSHELQIGERAGTQFRFLTLGHQLSGMPNFPRRVYTTWLNSALRSEFDHFYRAMTRGLDQLGVKCPVYMLKADGGTLPLEMCAEQPCQSVHSGPSASVLGAMALVSRLDRDTILLDIGGTTTDIGLFADGIPLLEPYGVTVAGRPTLVRALSTKSIGLGGDTMVSRERREYRIGDNQRDGFVAGGVFPTLTDGMIMLDGNSSRGQKEQAEAAMLKLAPDSLPHRTAVSLLQHFAHCISEKVEEMLEETYSRPVYTVSALLGRKRITPQSVILIGGPAASLKDIIQDQLGLPCVVPEHYEVANAVGAAGARSTFQVSLYADTSRNTMFIPELSLTEKPGRGFSMSDGEERLKIAAQELARKRGIDDLPPLDFVERLETNCVKGFSTTGKIITLKAQIRAGLESVETVI